MPHTKQVHVHKKRRLWRWPFRIGMLMVILPLASLFVVRTAGWLDMRKPLPEIRAYVSRPGITAEIDTVRAYGRTITYVRTTRGEPKREAMLLVHGSPGSKDACLDYLIDTNLLARVDVVTYDRPGYGDSGFGEAMPSLTRQSEVLNGLMDSLGYARYWLVGHSYGAPVIVQETLRHPDRVGGLCLVAGSVSPELEPRKIGWRKWIDLPLFRHILPIPLRVSNEELMPLRMDLNLMEDDWKDIRVPVAILHGTEDALVPIGNLSWARDHLTGADTVITRAMDQQSHFIFWTHERDIADACLVMMDLGRN